VQAGQLITWRCQFTQVRKLEFLMAEALAGSHDAVVTVGGIQSNHCRATSTAARFLGLEPHLVLRNTERGASEDPGLVGNLLVERMQGAYIHQVRCSVMVPLCLPVAVAAGGDVQSCLLASGRRARRHTKCANVQAGRCIAGTAQARAQWRKYSLRVESTYSRQRPGSTNTMVPSAQARTRAHAIAAHYAPYDWVVASMDFCSLCCVIAGEQGGVRRARL
jgi:hypothetical protein